MTSQEPIPTVEHFLSLLLETWNGEDYQSEVLSLLTHLSLQPFEGEHFTEHSFPYPIPSVIIFSDLEECYLVPLKKLYFGKGFQFQYLVVTTLTSLLRNFVALEWPRLNKERELTR